jgi:serine protease AprX
MVLSSHLRVPLPLKGLILAASLCAAAPDAVAQTRMSADLAQKLRGGDYTDTSVIVSGTQAEVDALAARHGAAVKKRLRSGAVLTVKAGTLSDVANDPAVDHLSSNHAVFTQMDITNQTIGADQVHAGLAAAGVPGLTGKGVGVAVIDSGVWPVPELNGRIVASVDFTDDKGRGLDQHGHGTHVAGIIAASGVGANDDTRGVAPGAHIISLKVLDAQGRGYVGDVIEAIDWAIANRERFNIRVMNLSLGGPVLQSWRLDPLCQAVERAYRSGIVVIASAGNFGRDQAGLQIAGGVTVPGNSPFVITVGASSTKRTPGRHDDTIATYSSWGPTLIDRLPKPEIVAPGSRVRGLLAPGSTLGAEHPELVTRSAGSVRVDLSGTSMAAAAVAGAAALMLQAEVSQFAIRPVLQASAQPLSGERLIAQGAGGLDLVAATNLITRRSPSDNGALLEDGIVYCGPAVCELEIDSVISVVRATRGDDIIIWADRADGAIIWADSGAKAIIWADRTDEAIIWADSSDEAIIWADRADKAIIWADATDEAIIWADNVDGAIIWADSTNEAIIWADSSEGAIIWADSADGAIIWADSTDGAIIWADYADEAIIWAD